MDWFMNEDPNKRCVTDELIASWEKEAKESAGAQPIS